MIGLYPDALGVDQIDRFSRHLADLAEKAPPNTHVPTCGDWTLADLTWHLLGVQDFWSYIVGNRPTGPESYAQPERPGDEKLGAGLRSATNALVEALSSGPADERAWTWHEADQSVGFSIRRQSHEALVHCVDGCLAVGAELPVVAPELAADGVDEMITIMLSGRPPWAEFTRTPGVVKLETADTADSWTIGFGRIVGRSPSGNDVDTDTCISVDDEVPDLKISGAALDLDLWLWGRPGAGPVAFDGDESLVEQLRMPID